MLDFSIVFWKKIASYNITEIRMRTDRGIGINRVDKEYRFPPYSDAYYEYKERKGRRASPPDFSFRSLTMKDLKEIYTTKNFTEIGWRGEFADIVLYHEEKKKYQVAGISDKQMNEILKRVDKEVQRNWDKKVKDQTILIKS